MIAYPLGAEHNSGDSMLRRMLGVRGFVLRQGSRRTAGDTSDDISQGLHLGMLRIGGCRGIPARVAHLNSGVHSHRRCIRSLSLSPER